MNKEILISYAEAYSSFLFRTSGVKISKIRAVYLFGSVARGDYDEDSDVDIFVDCDEKNEKNLSKLAKIALKNFYESEEGKKYGLLGVKNEINVKCGNMKTWELASSVRADGIILYSSSVVPLFTKFYLLELKTISDVTKRNKIVRKLAGRNETARVEKGLVEMIGGEVLDSRHYIIPATNILAVTRILSKENALFEMREIWM